MALVVAATTQVSSTSSSSSISSGGPRPPASGAVPPSIMAGIARPTAGPSTHTPLPHVATLSSSSSSSPAATVASTTLGTSASSSSSSGSSSFPEDLDWEELEHPALPPICWEGVSIPLHHVSEENFLPTDTDHFRRFLRDFRPEAGVEQLAGYGVMELTKKLNALNKELGPTVFALFDHVNEISFRQNQRQLHGLNSEAHALKTKVRSEYDLLMPLLPSLLAEGVAYSLVKNYCEKLQERWNSSYMLFCCLESMHRWVNSVVHVAKAIHTATVMLNKPTENIEEIVECLNKINQLEIEKLPAVNNFDYISFVELNHTKIRDELQALQKKQDLLQCQLDKNLMTIKIQLAQRHHAQIIQAFSKEIGECQIPEPVDLSKCGESEAYNIIKGEMGIYSERIVNFTRSSETTDSLYEAYLKMKKFLKGIAAELASKHPTLTEHQNQIASMQSSLQEKFTVHQASLASLKAELKKRYQRRDDVFVVAATPTKLSLSFNKLHLF